MNGNDEKKEELETLTRTAQGWALVLFILIIILLTLLFAYYAR